MTLRQEVECPGQIWDDCPTRKDLREEIDLVAKARDMLADEVERIRGRCNRGH